MKRVKKWLLPALTCLLAAGAVVLPPYISQLRDLQQFGQIHTEDLNTAGLPVREEPTLLDRMLLYSREHFSEHPILSFRGVAYSEEDSEGAAIAQAAQELLIEAEIIPAWFFQEEPFDSTAVSRILLLDPEEKNTRDPSAFWDIAWDYHSNKFHQKYVHAVLDAETGLPVNLFVNDTNMSQWLPYGAQDLRPLAERFFALLGLEVEEVNSSGAGFVPGQTLSYVVKDSPLCFDVSRGPTELSILLYLDQQYQGGSGGNSDAFDG